MRWILLSLLFFSCTAHKSRWAYKEIKTGNSEHFAKMLVYDALDPINDIQIQVLHAKKRLYVYLNLLTFTFPCDPLKKQLEMHIFSDGNRYSLVLDVLEGNQRLKVKESDVMFFLHLLDKSQHLKLQVSSFTQTLDLNGFSNKYTSFINKSPALLSKDQINFGF